MRKSEKPSLLIQTGKGRQLFIAASPPVFIKTGCLVLQPYTTFT